MDTLSHLKISSILIDGLEKKTNTKISKLGFKIGSIMPDMGPHLRFKEHHIKKSNRHVKKHIHRLQSKRRGRFKSSYILGKTSHYLSDTFCFVHNHDMGKNVKQHYKYEKNLFMFLRSMSDDIGMRLTVENSLHTGIGSGCLINYIAEKNKNYTLGYEGLTALESLLNDIYHVCLHNLDVLSEMIFRSKVFSSVLDEE